MMKKGKGPPGYESGTALPKNSPGPPMRKQRMPSADLPSRVVKWIVILIAAFAVMSGGSWAGGPKMVNPAPRDRCPVCGMFVAKFPDFAAEVVFRDKSSAFFDGTVDLFKYYFNIKKYNPTKTIHQIEAIYVTDYYGLAAIDGFRAYYVSGSDVYGPMGKELIPFKEKTDAEEFMRDHRGNALLGFSEVTESVIRDLD